jgi:hypothetical protein
MLHVPQLYPFGSFEIVCFRLNENTIKNGNSNEFANRLSRMLAVVSCIVNMG